MHRTECLAWARANLSGASRFQVLLNQGFTRAAGLTARRLRVDAVMKSIMENLFALQKLQLQARTDERDRRTEIELLRKKIPETILGHFDRLRMRGKKGVAIVRNGVCGECHITVAIGILGALAFETDVQLCGNCGRYLYLPEDEPVYSPASSPKSKPAKRQKEKPAYVS